MDLPPKLRVPAQRIRQRFNAEGILQRVQQGELRQTTKTDKLAACQAKGYPLGTRKQILEYYDGDTRIAVVHQVILPDGSIGGSGLPDPKALLVDGVLWIIAPNRTYLES